jgi:hypothetical protein
MSRRRFARSLGVASLALSCGCSLLFGLDGLDDGGPDGGGDDTGTFDAADEGDGLGVGDGTTQVDALGVDAADAGTDGRAADAFGDRTDGSGSDGADSSTLDSPPLDASGTGADATAIDAGTAADVEGGVDASPLASGLAVYYAFDEASGTIAHDGSGNGNDGTLTGGATFAQGEIGNAVSLNGMSQYVALPVGVTRNITAFSIAAWVHVNPAADAALANWSRLFDFGTGTSTYAFIAPDNGQNGNLRFAITTSGNTNEQRVEGPMPLPTGAWEHVAVTGDGTVGTLYVNGLQIAQNAVTLTLASLGQTTQNWLGRSQFSPDPYLAAQIDELRLYSRALSPTEVALLATQH